MTSSLVTLVTIIISDATIRNSERGKLEIFEIR